MSDVGMKTRTRGSRTSTSAAIVTATTPRSDRIHYLPAYGMDFSLYRNLHVDSARKYEHELVLVGGHNACGEEFVSQLLDFPLDIFGKWSKQARFNPALRKHLKARGVWGDALLQVYNNSKIVLNVTNWDPARYFLSHDAEGEAVAHKGYEKAFTLPTIADRMRSVIECVDSQGI